MRLGVEQRQGRAPRAAKHQPALDAEFIAAQQFDVGDEMRRRIGGHLGEWGGAAAAALIVNDDTPIGRVEKPAVHRSRTGAGTAVEEQGSDAARVARFLPVHRMKRIEPQAARAVRLRQQEKIRGGRASPPSSIGGGSARSAALRGRETRSDKGVVPIARRPGPTWRRRANIGATRRVDHMRALEWQIEEVDRRGPGRRAAIGSSGDNRFDAGTIEAEIAELKVSRPHEKSKAATSCLLQDTQDAVTNRSAPPLAEYAPIPSPRLTRRRENPWSTGRSYRRAPRPLGLQSVSWQLEGTWISPPLVTMAVTPSSGSGTSQRFSFQVTDSLAASDLTSRAESCSTRLRATSSACAVIYNRTLNTLALLTDAGGQPAGSLTPGSGTQQNSQCVLNGGGSSVSSSGNTLTLNLTLTFQPAFTGTKNVYMDAVNPYETVNWQVEGTWIAAAAVSISVTPSSGNATQQTFNIAVSDPQGAADLTTVGLLFNSSISTTSACAVLYNRAQNTLALLTDGGAQPSGPLSPGSGTQQNSQCILNGSGSNVAMSSAETMLVLNLAMSFLPGFSGTKSVYAEAIAASQTLSWQQEGIWTSPPVVTMAVTPSSGGAGTQQKFSTSR